MPAAERAQIFAETADRMGLADAIVEKDFWVAWILKQIFSIEQFKGRLLFKGGTSLSKIYRAIDRFSEDVDLAVDYAALGFTGQRDPRREDLSNTKRNRILSEMVAACRDYIEGEFLRTLKAQCHEILGGSGNWSLEVNLHDPHIVRFRYPAAGTGSLAYVGPQVLLEMKTHAEFLPHGRFTIRSFVAEEFPALMADADIHVVALLAKRTFWEKATILHAEHHRPPEKGLPERYSRHYYDLAKLADGPISSDALADLDLLAKVVRHKQLFYASGWARYDLARPGSLRLLPSDGRRSALERDYRSMAPMIFGEPPKFGKILDSLALLEQEVNSTWRSGISVGA